MRVCLQNREKRKQAPMRPPPPKLADNNPTLSLVSLHSALVEPKFHSFALADIWPVKSFSLYLSMLISEEKRITSESSMLFYIA